MKLYPLPFCFPSLETSQCFFWIDTFKILLAPQMECLLYVIQTAMEFSCIIALNPPSKARGRWAASPVCWQHGKNGWLAQGQTTMQSQDQHQDGGSSDTEAPALPPPYQPYWIYDLSDSTLLLVTCILMAVSVTAIIMLFLLNTAFKFFFCKGACRRL